MSISSYLLVLDLNGTLVLRPKNNRNVCYARPYTRNFLQYIFHPESRLNPMVWSSARRVNVDWMIDQTFGEHRDSLRTIWSRENLGLTKEQFRAKTKTKKDLQKIWNGMPQFSSANTLLLDDSPSKATNQPANLLCIPEYDATARRKDIQRLVERRRTMAADKALLAVIGILDTICQEGKNVAEWHHAGELFRSSKATKEESESAEVADAELFNSSRATKEESELAEGADAESPKLQQWFLDSSNLARWIDEGKAALERLEIPVEHGLELPEPQEPRRKQRSRNNSIIDSSQQ